ncbi:hypothetical protein Hanom_Chr17g01583011 [Helianthus anomalus]
MIKGKVGWGISTNRLNAEEKLGRNGTKAPTNNRTKILRIKLITRHFYVMTHT